MIIMYLDFDPTEYPVALSNEYSIEGRYVPRVTEILSAMLHEDYLMEWSNKIGLYRHEKYKDVLSQSADIGTYVHDSVENYISTGVKVDLDNIPYAYKDKVNNAFNSFLKWWTIITLNNYNVLAMEEVLVCKYFGGKLDLLLEVNGKTYLVDFKTSNYSSYKHFLQLSAYRYMLRETKGIELDGCMILMLDKKSYNFTELLLDFSNPDHLMYINQCEETFLSLVYAYYQRMMNKSMFESIFDV